MVRSIVTKDADVHAAPDDVFSSVCIQVSDTAQGVEAVRAAKEQIAGPSLALLQPELCSNPFDVQLACAELGDAGADAILLTMNGETGQEDILREMVDMACEIDLLEYRCVTGSSPRCIRSGSAQALHVRAHRA